MTTGTMLSGGTWLSYTPQHRSNWGAAVRLRKLWFSLGVLAIAAVLCGLAATYWLEPRSYEWSDIVSPDDQFRVSFPGTPSTSQKTDKSADGRAFVSNLIKSSPAPGVAYAVGWWENPAQSNQSTDELFARFRQCGITVFHAVAVDQKDVKVHGHPAKYTFLLAANGTMVWNLAIRVDPRIYSLTVLDPSGYPDTQNIQKFFRSISIR